ncbi:xanthine dehydrogenase molybdopterin binding subunit [Pseudolysobacter antarcticus]|uniref:Xanthine dehydrogenase molybdopterin binding subunit n=1 Tax=Pseudolysobacter antarcticus TaxID=2511995 RepID=A0A411HJ56_9GAMM|nr:xanthine dehydrogenase molybdopterin binding subunit [Pseudolysobacter antarcticus]QBB70444.1 xanthine dehydrogenase molybdopterin binding subunit [Pseudolysobacter antarcticus]
MNNVAASAATSAEIAESAPIAGQSVRHESAHLHVSGRAIYADDIALPANTLHAAFGISRIAHGNITSLDLTTVLAAPGVIAIATPADIPGENNYGGIIHDDPIFTDTLVQYAGQPIFAVAAETCIAARKAAARAQITYAELPPVLDIRSALAAQNFVMPSRHLLRGNPDEAMKSAPHRLRGTVTMGGQDHFYLEGQIAIAIPHEDGAMLIHCSTQHPTEVQNIVAHALHRPAHAITVLCRRMGGGFGGKESQPALIAAAAAILANKTGRPVKLRLDRDADMLITGKRHDFLADYEVGFDADGRLCALKLMLASRCGYSADLSGPIADRAVCHLDNAYFLEHVDITTHLCKTNTVSNTAFRGFGGPQGMLIIERIIDDIARVRGLDPLAVRRRNYYGIGERNTTHYGHVIEDNILDTITDQLEASSDYQTRRAALVEWNAQNKIIKRGIALTPIKFGISFNATVYNQAGALVHIYTDGTVLLNHGGTEMGQGLYTKVAQVVATEFGLPLSAIRTSATDTSKVPNTSATAASSGADLNGKAAQAAAQTLRDRLVAHACQTHQLTADQVHFADGHVYLGPQHRVNFKDLVASAYTARISLSSTGFYATPKIHWDRSRFNGRPFFYFTYGAAVSEVAIDTLTGETQLLRVDILQDVGISLNPAIDLGQIEGAYLQGVGWLTSEELHWNGKGELKTHAPSTYKIPSVRDWPLHANIRLLEHEPNREDTIHRSKAVGEPPLMLCISAFLAIRDAVAACGKSGALPELDAPATPEAVLRAIDSVRHDGAHP